MRTKPQVGIPGLAKLLSARNKLGHRRNKRIIHALFAIIEEQTRLGARVTVTMFGSFERVVTKSRRTFNPREREVQVMPPRSLLKFISSVKLRETLPFDASTDTHSGSSLDVPGAHPENRDVGPGLPSNLSSQIQPRRRKIRP